MTELQKQIATDLLSIRAVYFRPEPPFTWASGIKSPVYCDNRLTLTAPAVRTHVEEGLAQLIRESERLRVCRAILNSTSIERWHVLDALEAVLTEPNASPVGEDIPDPRVPPEEADHA